MPGGSCCAVYPNVAAEWTLLATAFNLRTLWRVRRAAATWKRRRAAVAGAFSAYRRGAGGFDGQSRRLASTHEALPTASMTKRQSIPTNITLHLKHALQTRLRPRQPAGFSASSDHFPGSSMIYVRTLFNSPSPRITWS